MEERAWNGKGMTEEEQNVLEESVESRLRAAAHRIVPDEEAQGRVLNGIMARKYSRKRLAVRVPAAVLAACLLLSLLCFARPGFIGEDVVVYAATEENGWQKLKEGERILLKKEPFMVIKEGEDIEDFDEMRRYNYFPYKCTFQVEVPEQYVYDRQMVMIRDDFIIKYGNRIEWWVGLDRPEDAGKVMQGAFRFWILDENRERQAALELELTKEDGKYYAELKSVWESEAYKKKRYKK